MRGNRHHPYTRTSRTATRVMDPLTPPPASTRPTTIPQPVYDLNDPTKYQRIHKPIPSKKRGARKTAVWDRYTDVLEKPDESNPSSAQSLVSRKERLRAKTATSLPRTTTAISTYQYTPLPSLPVQETSESTQTISAIDLSTDTDSSTTPTHPILQPWVPTPASMPTAAADFSNQRLSPYSYSRPEAMTDAHSRQIPIHDHQPPGTSYYPNATSYAGYRPENTGGWRPILQMQTMHPTPFFQTPGASSLPHLAPPGPETTLSNYLAQPLPPISSQVARQQTDAEIQQGLMFFADQQKALDNRPHHPHSQGPKHY